MDFFGVVAFRKDEGDVPVHGREAWKRLVLFLNDRGAEQNVQLQFGHIQVSRYLKSSKTVWVEFLQPGLHTAVYGNDCLPSGMIIRSAACGEVRVFHAERVKQRFRDALCREEVLLLAVQDDTNDMRSSGIEKSSGEGVCTLLIS